MSKGITSSAVCGDGEAAATLQRDVVSLCLWAPPISTTDRFSRTARYAADPKRYLLDVLGEGTFESRQHLFCIASTYNRDVYGSNGHKPDFEKSIAAFIGKSHGLFFITGVQAQLTALKIHCDKAGNHRVAWHVSSHLESAEEKAYEQLYGLTRVHIGSDARTLPTVDEILSVARLPPADRPAAILLEIPNRMLGCATYTFEQLERISSGCHEYGVALHLDGARLWDVEPYYQATTNKTFKDIAKLFDTMYISFYKGLGGITGAMLLSDDESMISGAKMWQRRAGGNPFTLVYETIDCERGFNENIGSFSEKWEQMKAVVSAVRDATSSFVVGGKAIIEFWPENPPCCQVRTIFNGFTVEALEAARDRTEQETGIRVFDRLWSKYTLDDKLAADRAGKSLEEFCGSLTDGKQHELEWGISSASQAIPVEVFVTGYLSLGRQLQAHAQ